MAGDLNRSIKIYIDHSDASKKTDELRAKVIKLNMELEQLAVTQGKDSDAYKKKQKAYNSAVKSLNTYGNKVKETERVLKNLSKATYDELIKVKGELVKALRKAERGTDDYRNKLLLLQEVEKELAEAQAELRESGSRQQGMWCRMADWVNKYAMLLAGVVGAITGLSLTFRRLAEDVAKMDDTYADVMKTTGMTKAQVVDLNEEFKKMDTRTSRESLNLLARDAGKLGKTGKKDIMDFVDAGNQINVALGEDLGEDAIKNIGKMVNVFEKSTETLRGLDLKGQMLAVGSAINELGASSTASEPYLVAFAGRLGGVAKQAGISMDAILGYASSLDQDMQAVEMSATALQKFIMTVMADPAKMAKQAGLDVKEFTELLKNDTNAAIKEVLRALNEKGGFRQLIPIFKDMGLDGARAVGVLSSMAGSIDQIDKAQRIANEAMREGTSVTTEYNIKNNTLAAQLDKAKKAFFEVSLELGESLNPILLKSTKSTTYLIKALIELPKWLAKNKGEILFVVSAITVYTVALKGKVAAQTLSDLWNRKIMASTIILTAKEKLNTIAIGASTLATYAKGLAHDVLAKKITLAYAAQEALRMAWIKMPWGAVIAGLTAVSIGVYKWATNQSELNKAVRATQVEIRKEIERLAQLKIAIEAAQVGTKERNDLIKAYNEIAGEYNAKLLDEKTTVGELERSYDLLTAAIRRSYAEKGMNEEIERLQNKSYDKQEKFRKKLINGIQAAGKTYEVAVVEANKILEKAEKIKATPPSSFSNKEDIEAWRNEYKEIGELITNIRSETGADTSYLNSFIIKYIEEAQGLKNDISDTVKEFIGVAPEIFNREVTYFPFDEKVTLLTNSLSELKEGSEQYSKTTKQIDADKKNLRNALDADIQNFTKDIEILKQAGLNYEKQQHILNNLLEKKKSLPDDPEVTVDNFEYNTTEDKEAKVKAALDLRLQNLENAYKKRLFVIEQNTDSEWQEENEKNRLLQMAEESYLNQRISELSGFHTSYEKLQSDADQKLLDDKMKLQQNFKKFDELVLSYLAEDHQKRLKIIDKADADERAKLKLQYDKREITKEQYDSRLIALDHSTALLRLQAIKGYEDSLTQVVVDNEQLKTAAVKKAGDDREVAERDTLQKLSALNKNYYESNLTIQQQYGKISIEKQKQQELDRINAMRFNTKTDAKGNTTPDPLISEEVYQEAILAIEKNYQDKKLAVRQEYGLVKMDELHRNELDKLKEKLDLELLTEEEYEQAKLEMKLRHAQEYAQKGVEFNQGLTTAVQSLEKSATAKIGAEYGKRQSKLTEQYNKGLISAEDYNAKKEQIDYEQRSAELETQKKYADANFGLQVAQIIGSTAVSAMQAYSAMAGIPYVGPALGAIAAAAAIAAGAAQISNAKAERDRIKSLTLESPGGGGSSTIGKYVSNSEKSTVSQAAEGRYDVIGEDDGKLYKDVPVASGPLTGIVDHPTIISEQGSELIVSAPDLERLQKHVNYPLVIDAINDARKNTVPQRAAGNYGNIDSSGMPDITDVYDNSSLSSEAAAALIEAIYIFDAAVNRLYENPLSAEINYFEFEKVKKTVENTRGFSKKPTS
ncbi:phage tail tape measure protein [Bacteroidales bacterium OttesenSCG-928-I21]|nr:phage tail tape measure protein [Bacteroidales bacterium OttesenSCG-928-I21]